MTDMEKVRQGVWQCLLDNTEEEYETQCLDCPYYSEGITLKECKTKLRKDFTELLKSQPQIVRCRDCKWRSCYCTEATDGTTMYTCNYPCANDVPRPADWFCADGELKQQK